ncbi:EAL domain-containing protein [Rhizobium lemnae]|uniref:EAL domain-containing protein n=1 Tax=Rhizobium lemnae TaxID=1214924 RepID=A0ABV8EFK6_9HYPH|nr:EAL domain-containing protein [Rhizobium lemnae]MCJ8509582.1 EAL domain-containing protein [Rhizobium lemnae]
MLSIIAGQKAPKTRFNWRRSIIGKVTSFLLFAVALAFISGAATGWIMIERSQRDEWRQQAGTNIQIASSAIRSVYTFVAVDMTPSSQIVRIITDRMIGDDASVLDTGYVAVDVLALASVQTKQKVWLLQYDASTKSLISITDSDGGPSGLTLSAENKGAVAEDFTEFFTGFAKIGSEEHYVGYLPIRSSDGKILGGVAASVGPKESLMATRGLFYRNSLLSFSVIMLATGGAIALLLRSLFKPVPVLIEALKRIARDETGNITPYQRRQDEIGQLATTIETLREAVVEREHLRQMREAARELEHLAHHDALTGLPNRAFLQKALCSLLEEVEVGNKTINVMLLDLDRFKPVNDTYGHAVGDQVLISTCKRVSTLLGPDDVFARLGGDEFALIQVVAINAEKEARRLAARILEAISRPFQIDELSLSIGASIGIARAPLHGRNSNQILSNADVALYTSKGAGRGCFHIFEPGMTMETSHRSTIELELMTALNEDQFEVHYQPIVAIGEGRISGYEALVRWNHPKRGFITPDKFIPAAEETGFIVELDRWVLKQACRQIAAKDDQTTVSVNVSAIGLLRQDLPDFIRATLNETGLKADRLEIEITETNKVQGKEAITILTAIRAMGVGIALDDFGTGFASLSYLIDLPVTRIKLDRRFISGVAESTRCLNIVLSAVSLARGLDISVTAEGVEHKEQLDLLRAAGCGSVQGYLLGRPQASFTEQYLGSSAA